jgi:hypothetical protein
VLSPGHVFGIANTREASMPRTLVPANSLMIVH